ncbi:anti-anti-sigma factor [Mycolicibacterium mageritense DSM 44476 = CIP 104973]|uniref:Anti-sigma factor antagonist n=1 Tax=Mycolicibacterium mageritense TaxID=53462 RepID=A0ABM7HTS6_MYCME|nr:STAS domain-containing protein [Mycolicibacterium mageritense]MCC9181336.1 STAS domain-containing protein [Mycolicibacterium mageritense]TXI65219.1 MAG: anti-sigma factor antagonist [Mycolicibacterium mageritense]CDO22402.1 anti-anti-sigma factor [Mycolicibacterium mageritense DSM 44476 = CIP 104973]BBX33983.1 anti-sigma factor antagonist [Mycolicibacterium mageritense]GJJ20143.1 anti-sigma factor antagonist [Mycolicibacterium mageritense]
MTSQPDPAKSAGDATAAVNCAVEGRQIGEVSVVSVSGTVDMLTAPWLEEAIGAAVKGSPSAVVVDMSAVDFLASAGMGVLVAARNDLDPDVRFAVVADGPATSRPLKLIGITDVVDLYATLDEALSAVTT